MWPNFALEVELTFRENDNKLMLGFATVIGMHPPDKSKRK